MERRRISKTWLGPRFVSLLLRATRGEESQYVSISLASRATTDECTYFMVPSWKSLENPKNQGTNETHHSVSDCVTVGPQLRVDVGQEPAERPAVESGSQGLPLRNVPNVHT